MNNLIRSEEVWKTKPMSDEGFIFEVQILEYAPYDTNIVKKTITEKDLGTYLPIKCSGHAEEWANTLYFCEKIFEKNMPKTREEALEIYKREIERYYIKEEPHPWKSINGNFTYQHYAAEFGFDIIGSEIGCLIKGYQMQMAFNRGAARQYNKPWFVDVSPWFDDFSMLDYSGSSIWGTASGDFYGHSLNFFEREYFTTYMAGASRVLAEAGGINYFYPELDENNNYMLTPLGEIGKHFYDFTKRNPDIGIPYTPFAIMLDYYHGTNYGSPYIGKAFEVFPYEKGDWFTYNLISLFFPNSWEAWGKNEIGTMTNSPYGDSVDVLLQNASLDVLNSYPVLILSGNLSLKQNERENVLNYVKNGGTLVINSAYLELFPEFNVSFKNKVDYIYENGRVILFGPDYSVHMLKDILKELALELIPFIVSGEVEYMVNLKKNSIILTVVNHSGISKAYREKTVIDMSKTQIIDIIYTGENTISSVNCLLTQKGLSNSRKQTVTLEPGKYSILEFVFNG